MKENEFVTIEKARGACLNIFSALFCQPEEEVMYNDDLYIQLRSSFETLSHSDTSEIIYLQEAARKYTSLELLVEYTRLFIGPIKMIVPPYSGLYFNGTNLMSEETVRVINFYNQAGFEFDTSICEAPDHIAVESEFLYTLIFNELKEIENGNCEKAKFYWEQHTDFFLNHYKKWVTKFCAKLMENTTNEYYLSLARSMNKFVEKDFPLTN